MGKKSFWDFDESEKIFSEIIFFRDKKIQRVFTKYKHIVAISESNEMYVWGFNEDG